jgi:Abnormal spindle-like microcephaly-assoc'd, ASPM-SPD-2-Hydin
MAKIDPRREALRPSKTQLLRGLAALGFLLIASGISEAKTIYVNGARPEGGTGTNWNTAFKYLQEALKGAVAGDQVLIAKGTYYPDDFNADVNGQYLNFGDRELSFNVKAGVNLYGGFAGNETSIDQRDPVANETILSGEIWKVDPLDPETSGYQRYWSLHVIVLAGDATFDSLTIEKGRANGDNPPYNQGGGVYLETGTLTLVDCTINECLAAQDGGAVFGNVNATRCTFSGNRADNEFLLTDAKLNDPLNTQHAWIYSPVCSGGAIRGDVVANSCQFIDNHTRARSLSLTGFTSEASGGAITGTSVVVKRCKFQGNTADATAVHIGGNSDATALGGAISSENTTAVDCIFEDNGCHSRAVANITPPPRAPQWTAAPHSYGGCVYGKIGATNCVFADNSATSEYIDGDFNDAESRGSATYVKGSSEISNSTFVRNETLGNGDGGGAIRSDPDSTLPVASCTFLDNSTDLNGTCLSIGGNVKILSNIFWDTFTAQEVLIWVDGISNENARARISNRLYPTPSTETRNIVKGSLAGVDVNASNADLGDPPERSILGPDPEFVDAALPEGPDMVWKTADDGIRLASITSPAVGKGHPLFLPVDKFDLDEDGDLTEVTPVDNANYARIQDSTLDLGAYEFGDQLRAPEIQIEGPTGAALVDGGSPVVLTSTTGIQVTETFIIRNLGTLPLRNLRVSRTGTDSNAFALTQPIQQTLSAGRSTIFSVTFTPLSGKDLTAQLVVSSNDTDENPFEIDLVARAFTPDIGVEQPQGSGLVDGSSTVNYGNVDKLVGLAKSFVVRNSGDGDLVISKISLTGANAADFIVSNAPARVGPNRSATFVLTMKPNGLGARSAVLNIVSNDPDAEGTFSVNLIGNGVSAPEIDIFQPPSTSLADGVTSNYGNVRTGLSFSKTFTIKNAGSAKLNNIAVSISGASEFKLVKPTVTSLASGKTTQFTVTFKPTSTGARTAMVKVTSNDANESPFDITVTGTGTKSSSASKSDAIGSSGGFATTKGTTTVDGMRYRTLTVEKGPGWNKAAPTVEVSSNLLDWFSGRKHTTVLIDDDRILKVRDNQPLEPGTKRYIRLK